MILLCLLLATMLREANAQSLPLFLNAGGLAAYTDVSGNQWVPDANYISYGRQYRDGSNPIAGTNDKTIYESERWFKTDKGAYSIPVPSGQAVTVVLHFAEIFFTAENKRIFDIRMQGELVAANFDIVKEAGGSRTAVTFTHTVDSCSSASCRIEIEVIKVVQNPKISGIALLAAPTTTAIPTTSPTSAPIAAATQTSMPTRSPTISPTMDPTASPTATPTASPSAAPVGTPSTTKPTRMPTKAPIATSTPTAVPTRLPSGSPTQAPVTSAPTLPPTGSPTQAPVTSAPTLPPTGPPTQAPVTSQPTERPSTKPTRMPSKAPVVTSTPTAAPTRLPTASPTQAPVTSQPTDAPVVAPSSGIVALRLIHAPTNTELLDLVDGMVIDLKELGLPGAEFNVHAINVGDTVQSVKFIETNKNEGVEPFAFCGDNGGDFKVCDELGLGSNTVTVIPYPGGGQSGTPFPAVSATFDVIDSRRPETPGRWIEVDANADIQARHENCFVMVGRKAYLVGGRGDRRLDIYDPVTRSWSVGEEPPTQIHHMQCVEAQGKLWIVSAWTKWYPKEEAADVVYVYDPATDQWSEKTAMPEQRRRGGAAVVVSDDGSKIYVSHGNRGGHETGDNDATSLGYLDEYDIATDTWTALSDDAPNPRDHTGGALVNGRICVAGGRDGGEIGWPGVAPTDCYDLTTGTWSEEAPIPQVRGGSAYGTSCDGKLMIAGGEGSGKAWNQVDVFDGTDWITVDGMVKGRHGTGLAVDCVCNQIHIASGALAQGGGPETQSVETYFPNGVDEPCVS